MEYWSNVAWEAIISTGGGKTRTQLMELPFALIGSHPACHIRFDDPRVPPIAYVAAAFADSIEVWPLCALAYPVWGEIEDQLLRLGHSHAVGFRLVSKPARNIQKGARQTFFEAFGASLLRVEHGAKPRFIEFGRRVAILGDDHPATLRIRNAGLATCDQAIIQGNHCFWLLRLSPQVGQKPAELVQRIADGGEAAVLGSVSISCQPSQGAIEMIDSKKDAGNSKLQSIAAGNVLSWDQIGPNDDEIEIESSGFESEDLIADVTDRLVSISQRRWWHWKTARAIFVGLLFASAIGCLIWIAFYLLLPILLDLKGETIPEQLWE